MATVTDVVQFRATAQRVGDRTIVRLPDDASAALPSRGQVAVRVTVDGRTRDGVVEPDGRKGHWIPVEAAPGATVAVELAPLESWPEPDVPEDLGGALDEAEDIADSWADITPMARWEWVRWVGATKNADTRAKRIAVTISKLRDGKRRPCCFDLSSCTDPAVTKSGKLAVAD